LVEIYQLAELLRGGQQFRNKASADVIKLNSSFSLCGIIEG
jgi:hypothetical protein